MLNKHFYRLVVRNLLYFIACLYIAMASSYLYKYIHNSVLFVASALGSKSSVALSIPWEILLLPVSPFLGNIWLNMQSNFLLAICFFIIFNAFKLMQRNTRRSKLFTFFVNEVFVFFLILLCTIIAIYIIPVRKDDLLGTTGAAFYFAIPAYILIRAFATVLALESMKPHNNINTHNM